MSKEKSKKHYEKTIVVPIEKQMWSTLRQIAFNKHISMNQVARNAFDKIIKQYTKTIDI